MGKNRKQPEPSSGIPDGKPRNETETQAPTLPTQPQEPQSPGANEPDLITPPADEEAATELVEQAAAKGISDDALRAIMAEAANNEECRAINDRALRQKAFWELKKGEAKIAKSAWEATIAELQETLSSGEPSLFPPTAAKPAATPANETGSGGTKSPATPSDAPESQPQPFAEALRNVKLEDLGIPGNLIELLKADGIDDSTKFAAWLSERDRRKIKGIGKSKEEAILTAFENWSIEWNNVQKAGPIAPRQSFDEPKTGSLRETLKRVWEAGGKAWDSVADPAAEIAEMRRA